MATHTQIHTPHTQKYTHTEGQIHAYILTMNPAFHSENEIAQVYPYICKIHTHKHTDKCMHTYYYETNNPFRNIIGKAVCTQAHTHTHKYTHTHTHTHTNTDIHLFLSLSLSLFLTDPKYIYTYIHTMDASKPFENTTLVRPSVHKKKTRRQTQVNTEIHRTHTQIHTPIYTYIYTPWLHQSHSRTPHW